MIYLSDLSIGLRKSKKISPYAYFATDTFGGHVSILKHKIMLYTGLKDKNEVEIYDGDIVVPEDNKVVIVRWSERHASFDLERVGWAFKHYFGEAFEAKECEVIGNIYENPNLCKNILEE